MKFLVIIFATCVIQSINGDQVEDAIQRGNDEIAQLKVKWENEVSEIEKDILPKIDNIAASFAEVDARVTKEVSSDSAKSKAAEKVKITYDNFIAETKKAVTTIANLRPNILEKAFSGKEIAGVGYKSVFEMVSELKEAGVSSACKENIFSKFLELAEKHVNEVTSCVVKGGSNFPVVSGDIRRLQKRAQQVTRKSILIYQRCSEEVDTACFKNVFSYLNEEANLAKTNADTYVEAPHKEVDMQKAVSKHCIERTNGILKKQVPEFRNKMSKC